MKHLRKIIYSLLFIAGFASCVTDDIGDCSTAETANAQVMLSLSVPSARLPEATRAIGNDETINSLHLLAFENGTLAEITDITSKYQNASEGKFYVAVKESTGQVGLALVANTDVSALSTGMAKDAALQSLIFTAADLTYMPMYGETQEFDGISRNRTYDVKVNLLRSLAKVEVQYNSTQSKSEFEFLEIEVLNTRAQGYVAGQGIPATSPIVGSIKVPPTVNSSEPNRQEIASAYVAETVNDASNKISVLIRGKYYGAEGYYRLDMIKAEQTDEIDRLTRNYKYVFALQNVNYAGRTRQAALSGEADNRAFNAVVMTLSADESDILDITTDDRFFLGVNSATMQLADNGRICFAKLKILTNNYSEGWKIVDAPAGVTFSPGTTGGKATSDTDRKVSSVWIYIDTGVVTSDFDFYVTSGKIRKTITVRLP